MKIILLLFSALLITSVACKKDKHYTCVCYTDSGELKINTLGRMQQSEAYEACDNYLYQQDIDSCYMEVR